MKLDACTPYTLFRMTFITFCVACRRSRSSGSVAAFDAFFSVMRSRRRRASSSAMGDVPTISTTRFTLRDSSGMLYVRRSPSTRTVNGPMGSVPTMRVLSAPVPSETMMEGYIDEKSTLCSGVKSPRW